MIFKKNADRCRIVDVRGWVYAIGDIHGRLDLLLSAMRRIREHAGGREHHIVCLGDYVDRGPDTQGVVEFLMSERQQGVTCLKGNHEQMMVEAVRSGGAEAARWLRNGGYAALRSYGGVGPHDMRVIPEAHLRWMERLPQIARDEHRIYVHAGLEPGRPLASQRNVACLWIREAFLRASPADLPRHVVHGHTPVWADKPEPAVAEVLAHRTNLDTGAYFTEVLTVGVFDPDTPGGPVALLTSAGDELRLQG